MPPLPDLRASPILCCVTGGDFARESESKFLEHLETVAASGIDWIQIREKHLSGKNCAALTREALRRVANLRAAGRFAPRILVNDRLDIALAAGANGVHLSEQSLPVAEVREFVAKHLANLPAGREFLVGVSCHSLESAKSAAKSGADYIFYGPIFSTPSKAAFGTPQGLTRLQNVCTAIDIPVLAIGGITNENASSCIAAGAAGLAAIRLFQNADNAQSLATYLHPQSRQ